MAEFTVKAAVRASGRKNSVFKLHKDDKISWVEAKMRRENEYQPWQIKLGSGRAARRYRAIKEGGVGENASYYIFYKPDESKDVYEVCPIDEWYSVSATQRYKTLTSEEAEQKFEQRHKTLNMFSVMHMKKNGDGGEEGLSAADSKAFKVSELDEWEESGDDFDSDEDKANDDGERFKKNRKKSVKKEKDDPDEAPEEGKEDSDEGDFEQREVDYISDSSSESSEAGEKNNDEENVKGIAEEEALRDLLDTDDDEENEGNSPHKTNKLPGNKNNLGFADIKQDPGAEGSDDSSDSDDYDVDEDKMDSLFMKKSLPAQLVKQEQSGQYVMDSMNNETPSQSRSNNVATSTSNVANKRKAGIESSASIVSNSSTSIQPQAKRPCPVESSSPPPGSQEKMIEDLVKKYLRRKPTPTKVLLKDIKSKLRRSGAAASDLDNNLVQTIASIIKRLDPIKQKINDTTYFSLRN